MSQLPQPPKQAEKPVKAKIDAEKLAIIQQSDDKKQRALLTKILVKK